MKSCFRQNRINQIKLNPMIIAIDGPSGAGKSTLGKMLAENLKLLYLDTGAMYRAVGLAVLETKTSFEDKAKVAEIAKRAKIELVGEPENLQIFLDGKNVTAEIRTNEVGQAASIVSGVSEVRKILVEHQRTIGETAENGAVLDGRDIGSVVFPNADIKFFLTAKPEARARRRYEEDLAKGFRTTYEQTLAEINLRDERDVSREDSPLMIAEDAVVIDTSELDLSEVFAQMLAVVDERRAKVADTHTQ
jgi:CMP/dCMP kinase